MRRSNGSKWLWLLAAMALVAVSCGGDNAAGDGAAGDDADQGAEPQHELTSDTPEGDDGAASSDGGDGDEAALEPPRNREGSPWAGNLYSNFSTVSSCAIDPTGFEILVEPLADIEWDGQFDQQVGTVLYTSCSWETEAGETVRTSVTTYTLGDTEQESLETFSTWQPFEIDGAADFSGTYTAPPGSSQIEFAAGKGDFLVSVEFPSSLALSDELEALARSVLNEMISAIDDPPSGPSGFRSNPCQWFDEAMQEAGDAGSLLNDTGAIIEGLEIRYLTFTGAVVGVKDGVAWVLTRRGFEMDEDADHPSYVLAEHFDPVGMVVDGACQDGESAATSVDDSDAGAEDEAGGEAAPLSPSGIASAFLTAALTDGDPSPWVATTTWDLVGDGEFEQVPFDSGPLLAQVSSAPSDGTAPVPLAVTQTPLERDELGSGCLYQGDTSITCTFEVSDGGETFHYEVFLAIGSAGADPGVTWVEWEPTGDSGQASEPVSGFLPGIYCVTGVASDDVLNLRAGPGTAYEILWAIRYNACDLVVAADAPTSQVGQSIWIGLQFADHSNVIDGWVNARFIEYFGPVGSG